MLELIGFLAVLFLVYHWLSTSISKPTDHEEN